MSLSEPHTSGTALCMCVCMSVCMFVCLQPYTVNSKLTHLNILQSLNALVFLQLECSVGDLKQRLLKLKHAWQLTCGLYSY